MTILLVNGGGNTPQGLARNRNFLQRLGISPLGAHQVMNGQIITSPEYQQIMVQSADGIQSS